MSSEWKDKPRKDWKVKGHRIVECIRMSCKEKAFAECLCIKHYDEDNKENC